MLVHQTSIDKLLSSIPSKFYLAVSSEQDTQYSNRFTKNKKPQAEIKGISKILNE